MFAGLGWTPSRRTLGNIETAAEFALRPLAEYLRSYLKHASRLPVVAFDFTVSRHRDGPDEVLWDYQGNLLGDCWTGFQKIELRSDSRMRFAACWAHARRKIDECRGAFPTQIAKLESLIRMLYDVEDQIREASDQERLARRGSLSRHVLGSDRQQRLRAVDETSGDGS